MAKQGFSTAVRVQNRKASFEYFFVDKYVGGIVLQGTEIKSIRLNRVSLSEAYCYFHQNELFVKELYIAPYTEGTYANHDPYRDRKLLLKKKELRKLENKLKDQGFTIIPVSLFTNSKGLVKIEIALARGKKLYDKRQSIKERDIRREV